MARRRGAPSVNSLSPPESGAPTAAQSQGFLNFPRSASPSGFTGFLSKPTKWFNRSASNGSIPGRSSTSSTEPRSSTSSTTRKPKISHPTDPRPILDSLHPDPGYGSQGASRSVLDLSLARTATTFDNSHPVPSARAPSSPSNSGFSRGLGDLRNISRKPWSKSADDLGKISHTASPMLSPIDTTFAGKIEQYRTHRNDSVGSSDAPSPSSSPPVSLLQGGKHFPFPTISTTESLSSSPPPRLAASSSGSSPSSPTLTPSSGPVHARSHSFTPRLPSKLSAPKLGGLGPPSPKRKGSASSEHTPPSEDRATPTGSGSSRSAFPFNFSPSVGDKHSASPGLLAPPTIIEPEDSKNEKRTSQVVYHSGFINRLTDFSPAAMHARANHSYMTGSGAPSLSKGWKPFKLVLKGSKLYFYKPPSDRSTAVRDLFPTELVVVLEEEGMGKAEGANAPVDVEFEEVFRGGKGKERDEGRRRRAFWGRGTHPNLVVGDAIERGSFEALVHEAVCATTFMKTDTATSEPYDRYRPDWQDFASTVLFSIPSIVGRVQFETEFIRCCTLLVDGSEDQHKEEERVRVRWLADQYLDYYGLPADEESWKGWWTKALPSVPYIPNSLKNITQSSSMQGLYTASPNLTSSPKKRVTEFSPNLGAFSPRPGSDGRIVSLLDVLNDSRVDSTKPLSKPNAQSNSLRNILQRTGLSREVLVGLDAQMVARSLFLFNQRALQEHVPERITADICLGQASREALSSEAAQETSSPSSSSIPLKLFTGSEEQPHWLTKAILLQILISDTPSRTPNSSSMNGLRLSEDRGALTSRTHSRSEVISAWARIGEICRRTGDECSWRAIFAALCSRPIARLDKVWKRVDGDATRAVQSWVHEHDGNAPVGISETKTIPWASEKLSAIRAALDDASAGESNEWKVASLARTRETFESLRADFQSASKSALLLTNESDDVEALAVHCEYLADGGGTSGFAFKFNRVDQFMSLSLAAEPRRKGSFEPYFWTRPTAHQGFHPLTPLLFPEPLPSIAFLDRSSLSRGRVESNASIVNTKDIHYLRELMPLSGHSRANPDAAKMNGLDLGGTVIVLYNGELTLLVQPGNDALPPSQPGSRAPSRPPSMDASAVERTFNRAPSIRVKPGPSQSLERKPSQLRRNSLPSLSKKPSFITADVCSDRPLRVVVQAGTLDKLVDVLVEGLHGISVSVADDNGEMPLNGKKTRELRVDMDEYSTVWWSTFRSFVTPLVFFELLRKRYLAAGVNAETPCADDISLIVRTRSQIFDTMTRWVTSGGGAQDALDDSALYSSIMEFLRRPIAPPSDDAEECLKHGLSLLDDMRKELLATITTQTFRPLQRSSLATESGTRRSIAYSFGSEPPDIDKVDAEELVNNLDAMAGAAFRNVIQEDLFITADILEVQSADRTGWFPTREPTSISDEVEIQCMHSYLHDVEPSAMISELGQDSLYRLLPPAARGCVRAFGILRKWLISKLVGPKINLRTRQARMELLLQAVEVCRLRSTEINSSTQPLAERPCIRSFVEAVTTSAILSVESRMYHRAWQLVASARFTSCDTVASLLCRPVSKTVPTRGPLTMDIGWLLEKMLEVISMPDVLDAASQDGLNLVNFDKRRTLQGLITTAVPPGLPSKAHHRYESCRQDFERLNNIEQSVASVYFDLRVIREDAHREATQVMSTGAPLPRRSPRPFQALVLAQQEKNKKDKALRDRLSREKRQEQQRQDRREEYLNKAMHTRRPTASTPKQHRTKKSMSSAFLQFMRPISSAFISETATYTGPKRTPEELDFTPSGKPSHVLNVVDARVSQFINSERSFTFQVDTEDGGHYLLQAMDKGDMKKWMDTIDRVSKTAAQRRLTYLGHNSKMQMSEHLLNPGSVSRDPRADFLLCRESQGEEVEPGTVPSVIERLIAEVDTRGLTEIGIYRVAGAHSEVNALKEALNRGEWPIDKYTDINAVCDLIKAWFRVLPSGMFPSEHYSDIMAAAANDSMDLEARLSTIRRIVHTLPGSRFDLLRRLMEHLDRVTDFEEQNQMTADSLATVFSPNLLRSSNNDIGFFFANMSSAHRAVKMLITHIHTIFDDAEPEADAERDDSSDVEQFEQFDEPIPEEDEEDDDILSASHEMSDGDDETSRLALSHDFHS
ncbi:unnamed protein product [Somion occarium]|uniref:Uncharacterized protein n=1 Tax=Somion occarium TaxID=3059160 RepID=A0ABP1DV46_9APHY